MLCSTENKVEFLENNRVPNELLNKNFGINRIGDQFEKKGYHIHYRYYSSECPGHSKSFQKIYLENLESVSTSNSVGSVVNLIVQNEYNTF